MSKKLGESKHCFHLRKNPHPFYKASNALAKTFMKYIGETDTQHGFTFDDTSSAPKSRHRRKSFKGKKEKRFRSCGYLQVFLK